METVENIVIIGAGIAGLATALGLHRLGIKSLVLESSESLRVTGYWITTYTNAWKALDALGIGESLRRQTQLLNGSIAGSTSSGLPNSEISYMKKATHGYHEVRCIKRQFLLEVFHNELPKDTIKFSSKVVSIEDVGHLKLVHMADGSTLKTKVLIGCDGINSKIAKSLGLKKPIISGWLSIRGVADFKGSHHGFEHKLLQFNGDGVRSGFVYCDDKTIYWFFTFIPTQQENGMTENPAKMKEFVLSKLSKLPDHVKTAIAVTNLDTIICSPLRFRNPLELLFGGEKIISKGNVCVAGDALHPMTPNLAQGGGSALEDGVVLARCLAPAFTDVKGDEEWEKIEEGLKRFAGERRWRSFELLSTSYVLGLVEQSDGMVMSFLREKIFAGFLSGLRLIKADFDCGKLTSL